ncbi:WXG100 family type VII secretion target [Streptomyces sp. NPDC003952]
MATDFESHTHQELLAMLASANAETLKARGDQLTDAAAAIKEIGESLKDHRVTGWEGESGTAFQDWVSRAGNATLRLSEYSAEGGKQLTQASQVVIEVKANMPKYDATAAANLDAAREFHNDPDAQQIGQQAHSKLSGDRQQAIQQMTKLAQGYEASATGMEMAEIPTFPEPPAAFIPPRVHGSEDVARSGGGMGGTGAGGSSYVPVTATPSGSSPDVGSSGGAGSTGPSPTGLIPTGPTPGPVPAPPDRSIGTGLDTVGPVPSATLPPAPGVPGGPGPVGPGGAAPGVTPGGFVPPLTLSPGGGVSKPIGGVGPGGFAPGGAIPGLGGVGGKGGGPGSVAGLPARDSGISGGRPVTPGGGPGTSIPRGTVIGSEGSQATGRGMGMGGGMGGGPYSGSGGASMAGRRLASEPGGVVGGRQPGAGSRSIAGGQSFTQGGTGLVRGGTGTGPVGGPMGHGGTGAHAPGRRGDGQRGERADYLAEDAETWHDGRGVVPPVID